MPLSSEDRFFGGKRGSASKALRGMRDHYGPEKGTEVFYASLNLRKRGRSRGAMRDAMTRR